MRFTFFVLVCSLASAGSAAAQAAAQPRRDARLLITVADPSGAIVPNAKVSVVGQDADTKALNVTPVQTAEQGVATIGGLLPGRYAIVAEFPGFELGMLRDVRVKAGDNRHIVVLPIQRVQDTVSVSQDTQAAAADRNGTFGTTLTREQVTALSDDPAEMQQQILDMAGGQGTTPAA